MSVSVSVVSHGHGDSLRRLIELLAQTPTGIIRRVWITLNVPEPEFLIWWAQTLDRVSCTQVDVEWRVIENTTSLGFAQNHNQAFEQELAVLNSATWFCVLNPDVFWHINPFPALLTAARSMNVACCYPRQVTSTGVVQDYQRTLITPGALVRRRLLGQSDAVAQIDWVCGAFMMLRSSAFRDIQGFDNRYHLYCEDVDLCLRLRLAGHSLVEASEACIVHDAHRNSLKKPRHFVWHVSSLLRLWFSASYRRYRALQAGLERLL